MDFSPLTFDDMDLVRPYLGRLQSRTCDFTMGGIFIWRDFFRMEYAVSGETLFSRLHDAGNCAYYNLPLGGDMPGALTELVAAVRQGREPVRFCTVPEVYLPLFQERFESVRITEQPEYFDYLYWAEDLRLLHGKKYSGQRNQISQFMRSADSWAFCPLTAATLEAVKDFYLHTYHMSPDPPPSEQAESRKILEVLDNLERYDMFGGCLTENGRVVGFSLAEILGDTMYVHVEKADRECKGAYQMLVNQFARAYAGEGVTYINREDDMGDPGLRMAKLAYHPAEILKKYIVEA